MQGSPAQYLGRIVDKNHFRAFVYGAKNQTKLVESWDEFEACMQSGIWFATPIEADNAKDESEQEFIKNKRKRKSKIVESVIDESMSDEQVII